MILQFHLASWCEIVIGGTDYSTADVTSDDVDKAAIRIRDEVIHDLEADGFYVETTTRGRRPLGAFYDGTKKEREAFNRVLDSALHQFNLERPM